VTRVGHVYRWKTATDAGFVFLVVSKLRNFRLHGDREDDVTKRGFRCIVLDGVFEQKFRGRLVRAGELLDFAEESAIADLSEEVSSC
jgi:hypothetical protein